MMLSLMMLIATCYVSDGLSFLYNITKKSVLRLMRVMKEDILRFEKGYM